MHIKFLWVKIFSNFESCEKSIFLIVSGFHQNWLRTSSDNAGKSKCVNEFDDIKAKMDKRLYLCNAIKMLKNIFFVYNFRTV